MARDFDHTSSQYAETANIVVAAAPMTMAVKMQLGGDSTERYAFIQFMGTTHRISLSTTRVTGPPYSETFYGRVRTSVVNNAVMSWATSTPLSWPCVMIVHTTSTDHKLYVDGALRDTSATSVAVNMTSGSTRLAANWLAAYWSGWLEWAAIWPCALTLEEHIAMNNGVPPSYIRPEELVNGACWPLVSGQSPEPNLSGTGLDLTLNNGPTVANGPPMGIPDGQLIMV